FGIRYVNRPLWSCPIKQSTVSAASQASTVFGAISLGSSAAICRGQNKPMAAPMIMGAAILRGCMKMLLDSHWEIIAKASPLPEYAAVHNYSPTVAFTGPVETYFFSAAVPSLRL